MDPHVPTRPGELFSADGVTFSERSFQGYKHAIVLRGPCTRVLGFLPVTFKSDAPHTVESCIQALRSDPIFRVEGYDICPRMKLDLGGEWLPESEART
jgi:hypothetical protein